MLVDLQCGALHLLGFDVIQQGEIGLAESRSQVRFGLGLVFQIGADALGGLVHDLPQLGGVAAGRAVGIGAAEHVFHEGGDQCALPRLGRSGLDNG